MRKILLGMGVLLAAVAMQEVRAIYQGDGFACETYTGADGNEQISFCWATRKTYLLE